MKVCDIRKEIIIYFKMRGIDQPVLDCDIIISHVLDIERHTVITDINRELNDSEVTSIRELVGRRGNFEPVAYLVNRKEFYSIDFYVDENVLIPRPETELLVDLVLYYTKHNSSVLDLCCGSGAIAIAIKHNRPDLLVCASDISERALQVAKKNCMELFGDGQIAFSLGDLFDPFRGSLFDIVVSNPPYVNKELIPDLPKELQYEPDYALYADDKGRAVIYTIIDQAKDFLKSSGLLILEIGSEMGDYVFQLGTQHGYTVSMFKDYAGLPRAVVLKI